MKNAKNSVAYRKLITESTKSQQHSYSPYSKFRVGAALLTKSGKIITGSNIENSSYSLTICAERTALFKAISTGHNKFVAMAITSKSGNFTPPCGACRQVIFELAGNIDIILSNSKGSTMVFKIDELIPFAFSKKYLKKK